MTSTTLGDVTPAPEPDDTSEPDPSHQRFGPRAPWASVLNATRKAEGRMWVLGGYRQERSFRDPIGNSGP